jgi:hypothetical protein
VRVFTRRLHQSPAGSIANDDLPGNGIAQIRDFYLQYCDQS